MAGRLRAPEVEQTRLNAQVKSNAADKFETIADGVLALGTSDVGTGDFVRGDHGATPPK